MIEIKVKLSLKWVIIYISNLLIYVHVQSKSGKVLVLERLRRVGLYARSGGV